MKYLFENKSFMLLFVFLLFMQNTVFAQNMNDTIHLNLQKAIEMAMNESPTMRIADRDVQVKKYYKKEQIVSLFPDLSASASYNRTIQKQKMTMEFGEQAMEIEVGTFNNYSAGLSLSLPLVMPTLWSSLKLSQLDVELALEKSRSSKISLINQVKQAYYSYLYAKEAYQVLLLNYQNVSLNYKIVSDKYEQGLASEFDKLRAEVQLKNQRPNLTSAQNATRLTELMLKVVIGMEVNEPVKFDGSLSEFESSLSNDVTPDITLSLSGNSNLIQLDYAKKQLEIARKITIAASCPSLVFIGSATYSAMSNDFKFSQYNWFPYSMVGFSLNVPLVSWASTAYKLKQNRLSIDNINDQKLNIERSLRVSLLNNVNTIDKAREDYLSNKETVMQAERAYNISKKQYEVGMSTWLDLSSAELALTSARLTYNQSIFNYISALADLDELLGK